MIARAFRATGLLVGGIVLALLSTGTPVYSAPNVPSSMAALGDSLSRGFNSCGWLFDCTQRSWSTGDSEVVESHFSRIERLNPSITGNVFNNARTGARSGLLPDQATAAVAQGVDYVTILIGANDACPRELNITKTDEYRENVNQALQILKTGLPDADIFIASVPDVVRLWELAYVKVEARNAWTVGKLCQTVLSNPGSTAPVDMDRRAAVSVRIDEYNVVLEEACLAYGDHCRFDGGALHNYQFTLADISEWDYFHLNALGQRNAAKITYEAGFNWLGGAGRNGECLLTSRRPQP